MKTSRLLLTLALVLSLAACIVEPAEEGATGLGAQAVDGPGAAPSDMDVEALYRWYLAQGIDPCDPPPDPWHPFVRQGYCSIDFVAP